MKKNIYKLGEIERTFKGSTFNHFLGVDKIGGDCVAGPIIAVACCLPKKHNIKELHSSKKLSATRQEKLFYQIKHQAQSLGVAIVNVETIDMIGVAQANILAMHDAVKRAKEHSKVKFDMILVNGKEMIPHLKGGQCAFAKGNERSWNIAAAFIVAKITRDQLMSDYHENWPDYGFNGNKGYPTPDHYKALKEHGPCELHRKNCEYIINMSNLNNRNKGV